MWATVDVFVMIWELCGLVVCDIVGLVCECVYNHIAVCRVLVSAGVCASGLSALCVSLRARRPVQRGLGELCVRGFKQASRLA